MVKSFPKFSILTDHPPTYGDNLHWTSSEMKYLLWRTTSLNLSIDKIKVTYLGDELVKGTVYVGFGQKVISHYLPGEKLSTVRGSVYLIEDCLFIPTYHPRDLDHMRRTTENGDFRGSSIWGMDFKKALRLHEKGYEPLKENFNIYPTLSDVITYVDEAIKQNYLLAIDLETTGRDEKAEVFMIGLAHSPTDAMCIPIYKQGKTPYWSSSEYPEVVRQVRKVFTSCRQMYQNALFDVKVLLLNRYEVNLDLVEEDTMLLHHSIIPAMKHDLGFITSVYGQTPAWKDTLKESNYSIKGLSDPEARTYNLRDCVVLHQILPPMTNDAKESGVYRAYKEEAIASIPAALEQMLTGIYVDVDKAKEWKRDIKKRLERSEKILKTSANLPEKFNLLSGDHLRWFLFQEPLEVFKDLEKKLQEYELVSQQAIRCEACDKKSWLPKDIVEADDGKTYVCTKCGSITFTPQEEFQLKARSNKETKKYTALCGVQRLRELTPIYPLRFHSKVTKSHHQATDADARLSFEVVLLRRIKAIEGFAKATNDQMTEKAGLEKVLAWIQEYDKFSKFHKYHSTYTEFPTWDDGCLHCSILLHGTETGRPAARRPNLLNQPKDEPKLREVYAAPPGHVIVSGDYEGFEIGCLAYITKDPLFIEDVESGNVHDVNTRNIYDIDKTSKDWKVCRKAAKIFQFALIQYGGSARNTAQKMTLVVPHMPVSEKQLTLAMNKYFNRYEVFGQWREAMAKKATEDHVTESAFGRKRKLYGRPDQRVRQGYNFPAQATAAGVMNRVQAMCLKARDKAGLKAKLQIQIYDDLRWVCPTGEVDSLIRLIKPIMEQEFDIGGVMRKFKVDIEVGKSWASLQEYKG